jgi:hypothetical protein
LRIRKPGYAADAVTIELELTRRDNAGVAADVGGILLRCRWAFGPEWCQRKRQRGREADGEEQRAIQAFHACKPIYL